MSTCGLSYTPTDMPAVGDGTCCYGAAVYGPDRCTCWVRVHDLEQAEPVPGPVEVRAAGMCGDCAYRPGSRERTNDPTVRGDALILERAAAPGGRPFWCHDGMRRTVALRHPAGVEVQVGPDGYDPPIVDGQPYRADGQPGLQCAGWAARRRALAAGVER